MYAPVEHGNLKTYWTDQRERRRKTIPLRVNPVEQYWLLYQRRVPVARERSLSFKYGRPDESCGSLTLMYFGKCRASRINFFWSRWISLMIVSEVVMVESEPYSKIGRTHCLTSINYAIWLYSSRIRKQRSTIMIRFLPSWSWYRIDLLILIISCF